MTEALILYFKIPSLISLYERARMVFTLTLTSPVKGEEYFIS